MERPHLAVGLMMALAALSGPAARSQSNATRALDSGWAHSADPAALVLSVTLSGGYGSRYTRMFRLYGDDRLEETVMRVGAPSDAPERRSLEFDSVAADDLLNALVSAGVAGLTNEALLGAVRKQFPTASKLISGADCARLSLDLHLFRATAGTDAFEPVDSRLSVECYGHFPHAYSQVPEAVALAALATQLDRVSTVRGAP